MVSGTLAENIDLGNMSFIHIVGTGWYNSMLTGTIDNSSTTGLSEIMIGVFPWVIYNCTISNLSLTASVITLLDCKITGGTANNQSALVIDGGIITGGNLDIDIGCFNNCLISGGTFGDANTGGIFMANMKIFGGTFNTKSMTALNSNFLALSTIVLNGGNYFNCSLASVKMKFTNSTQYTFYSCATLPQIDMTGGSGNDYTGVSVHLYNSLYSYVTIGAGNRLVTSNSYGMGGSVTVDGGTWDQWDNVVSITGGTIDGATIGQTTPASGDFTNLLA